jgi:hypothetical protein
MKKIKVFLLLCTALFVSACSKPSFVYNNVDWLVYFYLDDYVDLDSNQKKLLDVRIQKWHDWHRSTELNKYKTDLISFKEELQAGPINKEQWLTIFSKVKQHQLSFRNEIAPEAIEVIKQLSDKQVNQLLAKWAKSDNDEFKEYEKLSQADVLKTRQDETEELIEDYIGGLSALQENIIQRYSVAIESTIIEDIEYGQRIRAALEALLADRENPEFNTDFLSFIENLNSLKPQELLMTEQQNKARYAELLAELDASLEPKQKEALLGELDFYIETIDSLMSD